jgi:hypothetical protein
MIAPYVSAEEAKLVPYPYVYVTDTGAAHELDAIDREYLEEEYWPPDMPYVKDTYVQKNGWGNLRGFCHRSKIPEHIPIILEPVHREPPPKTFDETVQRLGKDFEKMSGIAMVIDKHPDGSMSMRERPKPTAKKWWQFWLR